MADNKLKASKRTEFGKGVSRRLRRDGQVPAVVYGHGTDPIHIALPTQETFLILRQANVLLELDIEGESKSITALPKQITRDPITGFLIHVDLVIIRAGEKVTVDVPLRFTGEAARGTLVNTELTELSVLAPATSIPESVEVSVEGLEVGSQLTVADVVLPQGVEAQVEGDVLVVNVTTPPVVELEEDTEAAEGEAEEAADEAAEGDE